MYYYKIMFFLLFTLASSAAQAQKSNAEKILGCWQFKEMQLSAPNEFSNELIKQAQNTVVCFTADGKFKTTKPNAAPISGTYTLSDDGKTIIQSRDIADESIDENAEIQFLDDKMLIFKLEFGVISFDHK